MKKFALIWPKSTSMEFINYHCVQFIEIFDYLDTRFNNQIIPIDCDLDNLSLNELLKKVVMYDLVGVVMRVNPENVSQSIRTCEILKQVFPSIKIMAYGDLPILLPELFLKYPIDAIHSDGDSELSIESFLHYCNNNEEEKLLGIKLIKNGCLIDTNAGGILDPEYWGFAQLDNPLTKKYCAARQKNRIAVSISRDCPFKCKHCLVYTTQGARERKRGIDSLVQYLRSVYPKYSKIKLWSANFTYDTQYAYEFCNKFIENFPNITWDVTTRVDLLKNKELLKLMYKAGCRQIGVGVESISEIEINYAHKQFSLEQLRQSIMLVQSVGIKFKPLIMLGIPSQTKNSIIATIKYLTECGISIYDIRPSMYTPYYLMDKNMSLPEIENFNRSFYYTALPDVSFKQLLQIQYCVEKYKEILVQ